MRLSQERVLCWLDNFFEQALSQSCIGFMTQVGVYGTCGAVLVHYRSMLSGWQFRLSNDTELLLSNCAHLARLDFYHERVAKLNTSRFSTKSGMCLTSKIKRNLQQCGRTLNQTKILSSPALNFLLTTYATTSACARSKNPGTLYL